VLVNSEDLPGCALCGETSPGGSKRTQNFRGHGQGGMRREIAGPEKKELRFQFSWKQEVIWDDHRTQLGSDGKDWGKET